MTRRSVSLPALLLWVLMALLPLRGVASAWMVAAPAQATSASVAEFPCHAAADATSANPAEHDGADPQASTNATGQSACHDCDLCHSPSLVGSLPTLKSADAARDVWRTADARVPAIGQQPQRRPPRA